jgi:DNA repair exonuclease SbcCD ATPase subunit
MITIKTLKMRNFLSIGNQMQIINFNRKELVLVLGENLDLGGEELGQRNGSGKTSLLNALSYALYGWALSNIKKEHLINTTNKKNMEVTLDFESNGVNYRIVRGRKPNILEFYYGGVKFEDSKVTEDAAQGDSRETQQEIEKVIGMSQDMFCQIVAINTYTVPFLLQPIKDQRTIIEQLLGITLLSEKAEKLKESIKEIRGYLTKEEMRINAVDNANKKIRTQIESLKEKQIAWNTKKNTDIRHLTIQIDSLEQFDIENELKLHADWKAYKTNVSILEDYQKRLNQYKKEHDKEKKTLAGLIQNLIDLKSKHCHACKQEIHTDMHESMLLEFNNKKNTTEQDIAELESSMTTLGVNIESFPIPIPPSNKKYESLNDAHDHKNKLMLLHQQREQKKQENDPYQEQIESLTNTALEEIDLTTMNSLSKFIEHQEFLHKLLINKDSFIRKSIIEQNLNYLNARLNHYLFILGLPHDVSFKNDLSVDISELGKELSAGNLSRGELNRLCLGLNFSFRDVWENLFQQINLIFVDENMDNGMDSGGTESAVKLLRDMSRERGKDVWVISHKEEIISKANTICRVVKSNGFTTFNIEN